jgi:flagellar FliL protein
MSVQLAVMTHYDERVFENVKKHDFALRSVVMDVMRQTQEADIVKPDFRKELAQRIRDAMNTLLEKYEDFGGIEEIYFTSFIVQ